MGRLTSSALRPLVCAAALAIFATLAGARPDPIVYTGVDSEAEPSGPFSGRPNCGAADLLWTTAATTLGPVARLDLESEAPQDNFVVRSFSPGVSFSGGTFHIRGSPGSATEGFNITSGGSKYIKPDGFTSDGSPVTYTFSFDSPIQAFSLYLTGVGNRFGGTLDLTFNNGAPQSMALTNLYQLGGAQFAGFTNAGHSISSVSLVLAGSPNGTNAARMSIDEIRWVGAVPTPGVPVLLGLVGLALARRRR